MSSSTDNVLLILLIAVGTAGVWLLLRMLWYYPAPAFASLSLRRQAARAVRPQAGRARSLLRPGRVVEIAFAFRYLLYLLPFAVAELPVHEGLDALSSPGASKAFLSTLWQVVAAALGLSLVMVAFAFQAFSEQQRSHGGTLREFATDSRLVVVVELGVVALLMTGAVLLGFGTDAPAGWSATVATLVSASALLMVPVALHLVLRIIDRRKLASMREARLERTVDLALRHQLVRQLAEVLLERSGLPVKRAFLAVPHSRAIQVDRGAEISDIRLGALGRHVIRCGRSAGVAEPAHLAVALGDHVQDGSAVLYVPESFEGGSDQGFRRTVRLKKRDPDRADFALTAQLDTFHADAMAAAREGDLERWREVSKVYELVLLGLPRAAARLGIPFEGDVAAPGFFGYGPIQRIAGFLYDEIVAASDMKQRELIDPMSYFPQHIAVAALELNAAPVAQEMIRLYPAMYVVAVTPA